MNPSDKNMRDTMTGYKEGARGVDQEDNPIDIPRQRRKSWAERARETFGFHSSAGPTTQSTPQQMGEQAQAKMDSAIDDMKQTMNSTETGAKMQRRGSDIIDELDKQARMKGIGGNQLFGSPKGAKEGMAGNGFLTKYANESAPGENTA